MYIPELHRVEWVPEVVAGGGIMTLITGKLSDFEGDQVRIEGDPQTTRKMLPAAAKWCNDRLKKGMTVDCQIVADGDKKGWISKISEHYPRAQDTQQKMNQSGFGQPQEEKKDCTSSNTPAANPSNSTGLKTVEGQIVFINPEQHKVTVKDRAGESHTFIWPPAMHEKMSGLKQWWFAKLTGEHEADVGLWRLTAQDFFKRPDDWPFQKGGGKGNWQPRNEKPMAYESAFKTCAELVRPDDFPGMAYANRIEAVRTEADKIAKWIVESGGA